MRVSTTHRRDPLPEHLDYRDDGCDLHPACLSCPFSRCRYDEPHGIRTRQRREREREMRLLAEEDVLDAILDGDVALVESLDESLLSFGYAVEMDSEWVWLRQLGLDQIFAGVRIERVER